MSQLNIYKKQIFIFATLLMLSFSLNAGLYIAKYSDYFPLIESKSIEVLSAYSICIDEVDCRKKRIYFWESGSEALYLNYYDIKHPDSAYKIIEGIMSIHSSEKMSFAIIVSVYEGSHTQVKEGFFNLFKSTKPLLRLTINEGVN